MAEGPEKVSAGAWWNPSGLGLLFVSGIVGGIAGAVYFVATDNGLIGPAASVVLGFGFGAFVGLVIAFLIVLGRIAWRLAKPS